MRKSREEGNTRNKEKQEERKQDRRGCDHPWGSREKEQALAVAEMGGLGHSPGDRGTWVGDHPSPGGKWMTRESGRHPQTPFHSSKACDDSRNREGPWH